MSLEGLLPFLLLALGASLHCVGMCGPIQIAFASRQAEGLGEELERLDPGRIVQ